MILCVSWLKYNELYMLRVAVNILGRLKANKVIRKFILKPCYWLFNSDFSECENFIFFNYYFFLTVYARRKMNEKPFIYMSVCVNNYVNTILCIIFKDRTFCTQWKHQYNVKAGWWGTPKSQLPGKGYLAHWFPVACWCGQTALQSLLSPLQVNVFWLSWVQIIINLVCCWKWINQHTVKNHHV